MTAGKLLIIGSDERIESFVTIDAVLAGWQANRPESVERLTGDSFLDQPPAFDRIGVVWVVLREDDVRESLRTHETRWIFEAIESARECNVPVLITRPGCDDDRHFADGDGTMTLRSEATAEEIRIALQALWSQVSALTSLKMELEIQRAHQGGLCGQIQGLDEELRLASQLQREFLPRKLPSVDGIEFRAMFRPAGYVSGDIYDAQRIDETHVGFFIGDAVGHGVSAALLTMYIKSALQLKVFDPDGPREYRVCEPHEVLRGLNLKMCRKTEGTVRFATALYGIINTQTRVLRIARAGHPLPFLFRAGGECETINGDGALLGVFEEAEFETIDVQMKTGDRLLLYTDGFEQAFDPNNVRDYEQELKELANGTIDQAIERLEHKLDKQAGSLHQDDDLTTLILGINAKADELADDQQALQSTAA